MDAELIEINDKICTHKESIDFYTSSQTLYNFISFNNCYINIIIIVHVNENKILFNCYSIYLFYNFIYLLIYFWLCWVFVAAWAFL